MPLNFNRHPGLGETRDCTDPWKFVIIRSSGDVCLCCRSQVLGNLKQKPLDKILGGPEAIRMRERLLTGDLPQDCIDCSERGITTLEGLRTRVHSALYDEALEELDDLRIQIRDHREVRSELMRERTQLLAHIENLEAERDPMKGHITNLERDHLALRENVSRLENECDLLRKHVENLESERPELFNHITSLESERGPLYRQITDLTTEHDSVRNHASALESERAALQNNIAHLERELGELRKHAQAALGA